MNIDLLKKITKKTNWCWGMGEWEWRKVYKDGSVLSGGEYPFKSKVLNFLYLVKLWICVILNWQEKSKCYGSDSIPILTYNSRQSMDNGEYNWTEVAIGRGLLKGWRFEIYPNGT